MAEDGEDGQFEEIEKRTGDVEDEDFEEDTQEEVFDQPLKDLDMVDYKLQEVSSYKQGDFLVSSKIYDVEAGLSYDV